jgi:outer membrane protein
VNNQLSLILNVVLLVAVAVLYYLHFKSPASTTAGSSIASSVPAGQQVVYINTDSLVLNYDFLTDLQKDMDQRRANAEKQFSIKEQAFQQEAASMQKRASAGLMSEVEMRNAQATLEQKSQQLGLERQNLGQGLVEMERQMNNQWFDSAVVFLKEYNKGKNFQFILGYTKGGGIMLASEKLDISQEVIKGLNERYKATKASTAPKTEEKK